MELNVKRVGTLASFLLCFSAGLPLTRPSCLKNSVKDNSMKIRSDLLIRDQSDRLQFDGKEDLQYV